MSNCITDIKTIHRFLTLTEGNWLNSIYIECKTCKYEPHEGCGDYLCVPDENGAPVLLPVSDAKVLFTKYIDPSECLLWISHSRFLEIYRAWDRRHCTEQDKCPFTSVVSEETISILVRICAKKIEKTSKIPLKSDKINTEHVQASACHFCFYRGDNENEEEIHQMSLLRRHGCPAGCKLCLWR